jgi:hypothetical protein
MSPVKYELGFYIQEDDILHSHRRENLKSYIQATWSSKTSVLTTRRYTPTCNYLRYCCVG